jgi:N utilization substance protein B
MYQFDARGADDYEQIAESIQAAPHKDETKAEALAMAKGAWAEHERADAMASELAPNWPTLRQPVVDRNILRLAYYEMAREVAPQPVAINEAIELAKVYGSERSPSFINGVLDKIAKRLRDKAAADKQAGVATPKGPSTGDAWLDDALVEPTPSKLEPKTSPQEDSKPAEPVESAEDEPRPYNPWLDD